MLQYILECIAFQLVFLIIYDLFLKRETFFQWNRLYLIGTYIISMVLPWIKIEALKTTVPETFQAYPEFLWNMNDAAATATAAEEATFNISLEYALLFGGMFLATLFFGYKLFQIHTLKRKGDVHYFQDFTRIIVSNSTIAFSFFKSIFLGDKVIEKEHQRIVQHELVHIRQRHSYDLIFFELMRIVGWFNPLVYVYQSRISELHEFIADAQVAKTHKTEQYQLLLAEVFQTENISFINQFFKTSLIRKRIAMLQKTKSKKVWQLKYLLLVPLVLGMLAYTASGLQEGEMGDQKPTQEDAELIAEIENEIAEEVVKHGSLKNAIYTFSKIRRSRGDYQILTKRDYFKEKLLYRRLISQMGVKFSDDVKPRKPRKPLPLRPLPSTIGYKNYVDRAKTFQTLDKNLMISIDQEELAIRIVQKDDKNLGPGEFITVDNVSDLTGDEIRKINRVIDQLDFTNKILFFSDNTYAFVVSNLTDDITEYGENTDAEIKYEELLWERTRLLQNMNKKNPVIVNLDEQLAALQEAILGNNQTVPFAKVDEVPVFQGCEDDDDKRGCFHENMREHIRKNFRYPKEAQEQGLQGKVAIMFTMNTDGNIANVKVRGPHKLLEDEAVRIISRLPKVKPGVHEGKEVNVTFSIPITFSLTGTKDKTELSDYENSSDVPFAVVEQAPVFPGCENESDARECFKRMMQKHISKNFRYPQEAQEKGIQGRVNIMFTLSQDGSIQNVRLRGPDKLLEKEAARIISLLPKMTPGKQKGKNVNVPFSIPITFKLQGEGWEPDLTKLAGMTENIPIFFVDGEASTKKKVTFLNPDDIEAIFVLKGEAAQKKFGDKGKNGVVEITTKKEE